jgi:hypothetical protein
MAAIEKCSWWHIWGGISTCGIICALNNWTCWEDDRYYQLWAHRVHPRFLVGFEKCSWWHIWGVIFKEIHDILTQILKSGEIVLSFVLTKTMRHLLIIKTRFWSW